MDERDNIQGSEGQQADAAVIARVVHESVRAYKEALGQDALPPWDEAPAWMHESSLTAVRDRLANPDATPSAQHEAWLADKRAAGWRHGEVKDAEAKTHPLMVPYNDLPEVERRKDVLIQAVVDALTTHVR